MADGGSDVAQVAGLALALAQSQQATVLQASDNYDTKAVGVASFDAALFAALIAAQNVFPRWWAPSIPLILSIMVCAWCLVGRHYDLGPRPDDFYTAYGGTSEAEATVAMLAEMSSTLDRNDGTLSHKAYWFYAAVGLLLVSVIIGAIWLRP